jgi:4-amino-4-deoxy-L-arabinose transferase-like glycosyltransferase
MADDRSHRFDGRWMWLALFALVVRGGFLAARFNQLAADPDGYRALAANLLAHGVFGHGEVPTAYRPPLYPLVVAGCLTIPVDARLMIAVCHLGLGVLTVVLTAWLARRWGLGRGAWLAGMLVACDPILLNQSALVMTETLAACLATLALALLTVGGVNERPSGRAAWLATAGGCLGAAALCRPTFLAWAALLTLALAWTRQDWSARLRAMAPFLAAMLAVLSPWAVRNQLTFGKPIVTTTHGGYTLLLGNNADYYNHLRQARSGEVWRADALDRSLRDARVDDEFANDRREYELAWRTIREQPGMFAYASLLRVARFWGVLPQRTLEPEPMAVRWLRYATAGWYGLLFALAALAIGTRALRLMALPWLWGTCLAISFTAVHAIYWSDMRMRAPLMPLVCLAAAAGLERLFSRMGKSRIC